MAVLHANNAFSILVLSTKKEYSSFFEKIFRFPEILLQIQTTENVQIPLIVTGKRANLTNGGLF